MITRIKLVDSWFAPNQEMSDLKQINFLFGHNGTGKSTIGKIIAGDQTLVSRAEWAPRVLKPMVFNRDFIEANFRDDGEIDGVFTLGSKDVALSAELEQLSKQRKAAQDKEDGARQELDRHRKILEEEAESYRNDCWKLKPQKGDELFAAFDSLHSDKKRFAEAMESAAREPYPDKAQSLDELRAAWRTLTSDQSVLIQLPEGQLDTSVLLNTEKSALLPRKIIGAQDIDFGKLITRLEHGDWVAQGRKHFDALDQRQCPFCQQSAPDSLNGDLQNYFNEAYEADRKAIESLKEAYQEAMQAVLTLSVEVKKSAPSAYDTAQLASRIEVFDAKARSNLQLLDGKLAALETPVKLESLGEVAKELEEQFSTTLKAIKKHNDLVNNRDTRRTTTKNAIHAFWAHEKLKPLITNHQTRAQGMAKPVEKFSREVEKARAEFKAVNRKIREKEAQLTSVMPTVDKINSFLKQSGFHNFYLKVSDESENKYQIVRDSGEKAHHTLSEGEKSFVTFLYFYHLLQGGTGESGLQDELVVVFDDPVTSQDSTVVLYVSELIRDVLRSVATGGRVKQAFVATHNVFFHTRVANNLERHLQTGSYQFWHLAKSVAGTTVANCQRKSPAESSYKLMWDEVKAGAASPALPNTMRRILENYFWFVGGLVKIQDLPSEFEGAEKLMASALVSWANAGSHLILDDVEYGADSESWQRVFKDIFMKMGHEAHYNMMMYNEAPTDTSMQPTTAAATKNLRSS